MTRTSLIAIALLIAAPATAQDSAPDTKPDTKPDTAAPAMMSATGALIRAEAVEDAQVYALGETYDATFWDSGEPFARIAAGWEELGEVEDLVLDASASVVGVTVDVGGFLGIGERAVLLPVADLRLVDLPDQSDFVIVTRMSRERIEAAEEVGPLVGDD